MAETDNNRFLRQLDRRLGTAVDRVCRAIIDKDTEKIVSTFHAWKRENDADIPGFYKITTSSELATEISESRKLQRRSATTNVKVTQ